MNPANEDRPLSPISRRVFLLVAPTFLAACGSGDDSDGYADCIYCDAAGQNYEECDVSYCDYFDEA